MFMQPEVYTGPFYAIESNCGSEFFPADGDTPESLGYPAETEYEIRQGTLGRLSASGYMDCTDWTPYESESEALAILRDENDQCDACGTDYDFTDSIDGICPTCNESED